MQAQWSAKPYVERQHANLQEATGAPFLKGDWMLTFADGYMKTLKPSGHTVRMSDYDVHLWGALIWAAYTQEELDGAGMVVFTPRPLNLAGVETGGATGFKMNDGPGSSGYQ